MGLNSIGNEGSVHNGGGGSFANVAFKTGLILHYLERHFVGLLILIRMRIIYYACGRVITRGDDLLHYECRRPLTLPYIDMT